MAAGLAALVLAVVGYLTLDPADPTATSSPAPPSGSSAASASATSGPASVPPSASAPGRDPASGLPLVTLATLPVEARRTVALIDAGGPFPYAKDGAVFGNRERLLPRRAGGWYREYTVPTPGEDDRGPRRIVAGDDGRELFWTDDHYASFARVQR